MASIKLSMIFRLFIDSAPKSLRNLFLTTIEWKFECQNCQRFVKAQNEDILLKLEAPEVKSLEHQLDSFLQTRKCTCGVKSPADFKIKRGMFSFTNSTKSCCDNLIVFLGFSMNNIWLL